MAAAAAPTVLFAVLAAAPFLGAGSTYMLGLLSRALILGIGAVSLSFLVGGAGLPSLGHAAMLGVGAYTVAILDQADVTEAAIVAPAAILAGALFALVTGSVALRTSGVHFIMITLAFGQMAYFLAASLSFLGGDDGYTLGARTLIAGSRLLRDRLVFFTVCLGLLVLAWGLMRIVLASRFGRVLRAARENPVRVQALGFSPYPYRLTAYTLAGGITGLAGALLANASAFVSPAILSWDRSAEMLFMVILGNLRLTGAIGGALAMVVLQEILSHQFAYWRLLFGPLLVAIVLARGRGTIRA